MDQIEITNLKLHYGKKNLKEDCSTVVNNHSVSTNFVDLTECIAELAKGWTNDVQVTTFYNSFFKTSINSVSNE